MRWTNDDSFLTGEVMGDEFFVPDYPADIEVMGYFQDPLLSAELDMMIDEADLMGIDLEDPELMGAWIKNLIGKIKSRIQKRKAAKAAGQETGTLPTVSVDTGAGTAQIGPGGVTWTDPAAAASAMPTATQATGGIGEMLKNPWVIGGGAAAVLLLIMMMNKRKRG